MENPTKKCLFAFARGFAAQLWCRLAGALGPVLLEAGLLNGLGLGNSLPTWTGFAVELGAVLTAALLPGEGFSKRSDPRALRLSDMLLPAAGFSAALAFPGAFPRLRRPLGAFAVPAAILLFLGAFLLFGVLSRRKKRRKPAPFAVRLFVSLLLFGVILFLLPGAYAAGKALWQAKRILVWPLGIILVLFCFFRLLFLLSALRKRGRFIKRIRLAAEKENYTLREAKNLTVSVFFPRRQAQFVLDARGKTYAVTLLRGAGFGRSLTLEEGGAVFCTRLPFFPAAGQKRHGKFSFPEAGKPVLILNPPPRTLFGRLPNGSTAQIFSGDFVGSAPIFTAGDFLSALSRNTLDHR